MRFPLPFHESDAPRVLVIPPMAIGDSVVFNPLLKTLRQNLPRAWITLLSTEVLRPLTRLFPGPDEVVVVPDSFARHDGDLAPLERVAPPIVGEFDVAVDTFCIDSARRLLHVVAAPLTLGVDFASKVPSPYSLTLPPSPWRDDRSAIESYLDFARALSMESVSRSTAINAPDRSAVTTDGDAARIETVVCGRPALGILAAGGEWHKRYPPELVTQLIASCPVPDVPLLVFFGPDELGDYSPYLDMWRIAGKGRVEFVSQSLGSCIRLLSLCAAAVGNDCGLMHIAVALGVPVLALFGPGPVLPWFPYPDRTRHRFLESSVSCRPCYGEDRTNCPDNKCMREFEPALVWDGFLDMMPAQFSKRAEGGKCSL